MTKPAKVANKVTAPWRPVELSTTGELWVCLTEVHAKVRGDVDRALQRRLGIGFSELLALLALSKEDDGELRMQELADATSLNQSSVSRLVARLERTGLTERQMCENDRRGVYTSITKDGLTTLADAVEVYERTLDTALAQLSSDPELGPLMKKIRES
ncbi:MarR family transcriptional regulator [Herbihabitans rhizosphaerae]|uniref:MarR family transcriptional regulator n=1 Tax=Herbihabitans rhizosphaerae TaxID=1872711 RepID=A0A4V2EUK2_9PSEU|nr:MarR family transcriptional regulator [Herbihabitans rhizosphaerae]RZS44863.1 MarR family transcriptional regulator [Herbihabitans rhizosphaerae]